MQCTFITCMLNSLLRMPLSCAGDHLYRMDYTDFVRNHSSL
jgi:ADP-glucose pyrophosphorylase